MRRGRPLWMVALWPAVLGTAALFPALARAQAATDLAAFKEEAVSGGALLVAAYLILWLILGAYVARLAGKQVRLEAKLRALEDRLDGER